MMAIGSHGLSCCIRGYGGDNERVNGVFLLEEVEVEMCMEWAGEAFLS